MLPRDPHTPPYLSPSARSEKLTESPLSLFTVAGAPPVLRSSPRFLPSHFSNRPTKLGGRAFLLNLLFKLAIPMAR